MPELPEVELTRRGLEPYVTDQIVQQLVVRNKHLRWPIPAHLTTTLAQQRILQLRRRAKYLIFDFAKGSMIMHLGMSGSLRVLPVNALPQKHDHVDLKLKSGFCVRLRDPRRFGAVLWTEDDALRHPLLINLGPEPLADEFTAEVLYQQSRSRRCPVKQLIMDSKVVVGVGNIYANEALFRAAINPRTAANSISKPRYKRLTDAIKQTLHLALAAGGSSLRDFVNSDGECGHFQQQYLVYGRDNQSCKVCVKPLLRIRQGQRSTYYCPKCQPK